MFCFRDTIHSHIRLLNQSTQKGWRIPKLKHAFFHLLSQPVFTFMRLGLVAFVCYFFVVVVWLCLFICLFWKQQLHQLCSFAVFYKAETGKSPFFLHTDYESNLQSTSQLSDRFFNAAYLSTPCFITRRLQTLQCTRNRR